MADNLAVTPGTGATVGADLISTVLYQRVKLIYGDDGVNSGDVSTANPFPCNVNMVGGAAFVLGQQLAAASLPVVLTAAQLTSLTAPVVAAAIPSIAVAATITRPADTTAYTAGDVVYTTTSSTQAVTHTVSIAKATDQALTILACRLLCSSTTLTHGLFRVHIYSSQPTLVNGDNGAWSTANAGYIDSFDITLTKAFSDGAYGRGIPSNGSVINCKPVSGAQTLYVVLEARDAYVPTSGETFIISFEVQ